MESIFSCFCMYSGEWLKPLDLHGLHTICWAIFLVTFIIISFSIKQPEQYFIYLVTFLLSTWIWPFSAFQSIPVSICWSSVFLLHVNVFYCVSVFFVLLSFNARNIQFFCLYLVYFLWHLWYFWEYFWSIWVYYMTCYFLKEMS